MFLILHIYIYIYDDAEGYDSVYVCRYSCSYCGSFPQTILTNRVQKKTEPNLVPQAAKAHTNSDTSREGEPVALSWFPALPGL